MTGSTTAMYTIHTLIHIHIELSLLLLIVSTRLSPLLLLFLLPNPHLSTLPNYLTNTIRHILVTPIDPVIAQPRPQRLPRLSQARDIKRPHGPSQCHNAHTRTIQRGQVQSLARVLERAEVLVGIGIGVEVLGRLAQLPPPDRFACYGSCGEQAGAAEEEDGELAQRAGRGYGGALFVGDGFARRLSR